VVDSDRLESSRLDDAAGTTPCSIFGMKRALEKNSMTMLVNMMMMLLSIAWDFIVGYGHVLPLLVVGGDWLDEQL
jgi:hypothetical protein